MTYRVPRRVAYVVEDPVESGATATVYLLRLPDGQPHALLDSAAVIWAVAAEGEPGVAAAVAELLGEPVEEIGAAVADYLGVLVAQGWLEEAP